MSAGFPDRALREYLLRLGDNDVVLAQRLGEWVGHGPVIEEVHRRLAAFVDRIANGAKPADLPVELPTQVELVVNLKTARAIGLTIPGAVLLRADGVIE